MAVEGEWEEVAEEPEEGEEAYEDEAGPEATYDEAEARRVRRERAPAVRRPDKSVLAMVSGLGFFIVVLLLGFGVWNLSATVPMGAPVYTGAPIGTVALRFQTPKPSRRTTMKKPRPDTIARTLLSGRRTAGARSRRTRRASASSYVASGPASSS